MKSATSVVNQLFKDFPVEPFKAAINERGTEKYSKGFTSWMHFIIMVFAQISGATSLRDVIASLNSDKGKASQLFIDTIPSKSTLAYANEHRDWQLFEDGFKMFLALVQERLPQHKNELFRFNNPMFALDSTTISLSLSVFDWAQFKSTKGGIKVHTLLDLEHLLPSFLTITTANLPDIKEARKLILPRGSVLTMDRGSAYLTADIPFYWDRMAGQKSGLPRVCCQRGCSRPRPDPSIYCGKGLQRKGKLESFTKI
jgi:hypothetical protein